MLCQTLPRLLLPTQADLASIRSISLLNISISYCLSIFRFRSSAVGPLIREILEAKLKNSVYDPENTPKLTKEIADEIKKALKCMNLLFLNYCLFSYSKNKNGTIQIRCASYNRRTARRSCQVISSLLLVSNVIESRVDVSGTLMPMVLPKKHL